MRLGAYELEDEIGRGGVGRVFRALHRPTRVIRAVKIVEGRTDERDLERFRREAQALARAPREAVVPIHEAGAEQGRLYIVMDFMPGGSLRGLLDEKERLPWLEAVGLVQRVARALARCHASALIHRDLKPENVLLDESGAPRLADFGCVRDLARSALTESNALLGTVGYMSAEQMEGRPVDGRADVFSLGVILYELLTGVLPFGGASFLEIAQATARMHIVPASSVVAVPPGLDSVIARALHKDPARRPSARRLARELGAILDGQVPSAPRRALAAGVVGALLALGTVVAGVAAVAVARSRSGVDAAAVSTGAPPPPPRPTPTPDPKRNLATVVTGWRAEGRPLPLAEASEIARARPDLAEPLAAIAADAGVAGSELPADLALAWQKSATPVATRLARVVAAVASVSAALGADAPDRGSFLDDASLDESWDAILDPGAARIRLAAMSPIVRDLEAAGRAVVRDVFLRRNDSRRRLRKVLAIVGTREPATPLLGAFAACCREWPEARPNQRAHAIERGAVLVVETDRALAAGLLALAVEAIRTGAPGDDVLPVWSARVKALARASLSSATPGGEDGLDHPFAYAALHKIALIEAGFPGAGASFEGLLAARALAREGNSKYEGFDAREAVAAAARAARWKDAVTELGEVPPDALPELLCAQACVAADEKRLDEAHRLLAEARVKDRQRRDPDAPFRGVIAAAERHVAAAGR